jgi:hypothetical protein
MIDPASATEALDLLLSDEPDPVLFVGGEPTSTALRLHLEHALPQEVRAHILSALQDPIHARRLDHIAADAAARERALLRGLAGEALERGLVVALCARADAMRHLCQSRDLSVAASAAPGGVIQTADADDLVTLKVSEIFDRAAEEGELRIEVVTFDDARLVNAAATLQVTANGRVLREYAFEVRGRRFSGSFGIRKLPHDSATVEFRLYLSELAE